MSYGYTKGSCYTVAFATTALATAAYNLFPFQAGSETRVELDGIDIGILSSNTEPVGVAIYRGSTTPLSTATLVTPVSIRGSSLAGAAGSQVNSPSSSIPSTTSASLVYAGMFGGTYPFEYEGPMIELVPSQRLDVVVTTLPVTTVYATLTFREVGKNPVS